MNKLIIPQRLIKNDDLVIIPRREYEALVESRAIKEFIATSADKRKLVRARKNLRSGKYITLEQLRHEMGGARR